MKKPKPKEDDEEASVSKGIDSLRMDRKLAAVLDAWREAKRVNPEAWKLK